MGIWENAFKLPGRRAITEEEKVMLRGLAAKINGRSMGAVAALAVESTRPLHNLGSQALVFLTPMFNAILKKEDTEKFIALLENPCAVSFFLEELGVPEEKSE